MWAYDFLWAGHRILEDHTATIHLQMAACSEAQQVCPSLFLACLTIFIKVVINAWGPKWLTDGVCAMRHMNNKSDCIYLLDNK